jgi:hypothetical protein
MFRSRNHPSSTPPPSCSCGRRRAASTARASSEGAARARLEREEGGLLHNPLGPWRRPRSPARRSARRRRRRGRRRRPRDDAGTHRREARGFEQMLRQNAAMERLWSACTLQARGRGGVCIVPTDVLPGDAGGRSRLMVVPRRPAPFPSSRLAASARARRCSYAATTLQLLDEVPVGSNLYYQQKGTIFPTASFHSRPPPFQDLEIFPLRKRKCQSCAAAWGETRATTIYTLRDFARTHAPRTCQGKLWWAHRLIRPHKHSLNLDLPPQSAVRPSQLEPSSSLAHIYPPRFCPHPPRTC